MNIYAYTGIGLSIAVIVLLCVGLSKAKCPACRGKGDQMDAGCEHCGLGL